MKNDGDMYEMGYYNAAVIEEIAWGSMAMTEAEHWFSATYIKGTCGGDGGCTTPLETYDVEKIVKPAALEGVVSFGMG